MKINISSTIQAIFNAVAVALLTWLAKSTVGMVCAMYPKTYGGPLPDNSVTSHGIMVGGGALATATLFWPKIKPLIWNVITSWSTGGTAVPPATDTPAVPDVLGSLGDLQSIILSVIGSDARLAVVKPIVDYLMRIPQFVAILDGFKNYGWPTWWYIGVCWPNKMITAAAGTLPVPLPVPSAPPPVHIEPPPPAPVVNPPPLPVNVVHAAPPAGT